MVVAASASSIQTSNLRILSPDALLLERLRGQIRGYEGDERQQGQVGGRKSKLSGINGLLGVFKEVLALFANKVLAEVYSAHPTDTKNSAKYRSNRPHRVFVDLPKPSCLPNLVTISAASQPTDTPKSAPPSTSLG